MSIGVELHQKNVEIGDLRCELILWDLGGQEHFRFMLDNFVNGASGAILMFDLTRISTLFNLDEWIQIVRKFDSTLPCMLIGGKSDLIMDSDFDDDKAIFFQETHNFPHYLKVSSKTGENVDKTFELIVKEILKYKSIEYREFL